MKRIWTAMRYSGMGVFCTGIMAVIQGCSVEREGLLFAVWLFLLQSCSGPVADNGIACAAGIEHIDISSLVTVDTIVNNGSGGLDTVQDPMDVISNVFPTQSVAEALNPGSPDGLPDDGFFAASAFHPEIQLLYNNNNDGNNTWIGDNNFDSIEIPITACEISEVYIFLTSTEGDSPTEFILNYTDSSSDISADDVPDWFDEITESASRFYLTNDRDRLRTDGTNYDDKNDPAIFGYRLDPKTLKLLESVSITRTSNDGTLFFYGVTIVRP